MARLKQGVNVILHSPIDGNRVVFEGGADLPTWAAKLIDPEAQLTDEGAGAATPTPAPAVAPKGETTTTTSDDGGSGDAVPEEPPRSGKGSGKAAWEAYAAAIGLTLPDDATTTAKIIAAVDAAKG